MVAVAVENIQLMFVLCMSFNRGGKWGMIKLYLAWVQILCSGGGVVINVLLY